MITLLQVALEKSLVARFLTHGVLVSAIIITRHAKFCCSPLATVGTELVLHVRDLWVGGEKNSRLYISMQRHCFGMEGCMSFQGRC